MIHNNKVYANADEKFVKTTILYAKSIDNGWNGAGIYLFHDEEYTKPVLKTELFDLFLNGLMVQGDDRYMIPYSYNPVIYAVGLETGTDSDLWFFVGDPEDVEE